MNPFHKNKKCGSRNSSKILKESPKKAIKVSPIMLKILTMQLTEEREKGSNLKLRDTCHTILLSTFSVLSEVSLTTFNYP